MFINVKTRRNIEVDERPNTQTHRKKTQGGCGRQISSEGGRELKRERSQETNMKIMINAQAQK